jgi:hypothetical protein
MLYGICLRSHTFLANRNKLGPIFINYVDNILIVIDNWKISKQKNTQEVKREWKDEEGTKDKGRERKKGANMQKIENVTDLHSVA